MSVIPPVLSPIFLPQFFIISVVLQGQNQQICFLGRLETFSFLGPAESVIIHLHVFQLFKPHCPDWSHFLCCYIYPCGTKFLHLWLLLLAYVLWIQFLKAAWGNVSLKSSLLKHLERWFKWGSNRPLLYIFLSKICPCFHLSYGLKNPTQVSTGCQCKFTKSLVNNSWKS